MKIKILTNLRIDLVPTFLQQKNLTRHMKISKNPSSIMIFFQSTTTFNNIPCQKCPKYFSAKRNMLKHMATSTKMIQKSRKMAKPQVSVNIAHLDLPSVDVGDLLAIPIPEDPLPNGPFGY